MSDIDNFKDINDTYGHLTGDKVLKEVAKIIRESIRSTDIAGRYGGDEFVILLPETPLSDALVVAEKIRRKFSRHPIQVNDKSFNVTLSIGITAFRKKVESPLSLLDEADKALYLAKERGRDRTCVAKRFLENPQSLMEEDWEEIEETIKRLGLEEK
jgi:diguanylate cyclase (GGDEF)-like protein